MSVDFDKLKPNRGRTKRSRQKGLRPQKTQEQVRQGKRSLSSRGSASVPEFEDTSPFSFNSDHEDTGVLVSSTQSTRLSLETQNALNGINTPRRNNRIPRKKAPAQSSLIDTQMQTKRERRSGYPNYGCVLGHINPLGGPNNTRRRQQEEHNDSHQEPSSGGRPTTGIASRPRNHHVQERGGSTSAASRKFREEGNRATSDLWLGRGSMETRRSKSSQKSKAAQAFSRPTRFTPPSPSQDSDDTDVIEVVEDPGGVANSEAPNHSNAKHKKQSAAHKPTRPGRVSSALNSYETSETDEDGSISDVIVSPKSRKSAAPKKKAPKKVSNLVNPERDDCNLPQFKHASIDSPKCNKVAKLEPMTLTDFPKVNFGNYGTPEDSPPESAIDADAFAARQREVAPVVQSTTLARGITRNNAKSADTRAIDDLGPLQRAAALQEDDETTVQSTTNTFTIKKRNTKTKKKKDTRATKIVPGSSFRRDLEDDPIEDCDSSQQSAALAGRKRKRQSRDGQELAYGSKRRRKSTGLNPSSFYGRRGARQESDDEYEFQLEEDNGGKDDPEWDAVEQPRITRSQKKKSKQKQNEVFDLVSSDSESEATSVRSKMECSISPARSTSSTRQTQRQQRPIRNLSSAATLDPVRIAIGKKVFSSNCEIRLKEIGREVKTLLILSYNSSAAGAGTKAMNKGRRQHKIILDDHLEELKFNLVGDDKETNESDEAKEPARSDDKTNGLTFDESEQMTFLAMRICPTKENGLKLLSTSYLQEITKQPSPSTSRDWTKQYVVVEFRSDKDMIQLLTFCRRNRQLAAYASEDAQVEPSKIPHYAAALLEDSKTEKQRREESLGSPRSSRRSRRRAGTQEVDDDEKILLVFPFGVSEKELDIAAKGLTLANLEGGNAEGNMEEARNGNSTLEVQQPGTDSDLQINSDDAAAECDQKSKGRTHTLTIRGEDRSRLDPGEFLNDTLIDFWMQWIWRKQKAADVHFFTSHFYTTLRKEGPAGVTSWTARRGIDIFQKKFIFIPINKSLHWSLCVVVNPASILENVAAGKDKDQISDDALVPCLLFFDSLKAHSKKEVARFVRKWLNSEWKRHKYSHPDPFTARNMPVYDPRVPYQDNSWDCGVFVCFYAHAMYKNRRKVFTFGDSRQTTAFANAITHDPEFDFGMENIATLREDMGTLVDNLSRLYLPWKAQQELESKEQAREEKKKRKEMQLAIEREAANKSEKKEIGDGKRDVEERENQASRQQNDGTRKSSKEEEKGKEEMQRAKEAKDDAEGLESMEVKEQHEGEQRGGVCDPQNSDKLSACLTLQEEVYV